MLEFIKICVWMGRGLKRTSWCSFHSAEDLAFILTTVDEDGMLWGKEENGSLSV